MWIMKSDVLLVDLVLKSPIWPVPIMFVFIAGTSYKMPKWILFKLTMVLCQLCKEELL